MRTILAASVGLSSRSQLFHTTPASLGALLPREGLVIVLSPPGLACSSLRQLIPTPAHPSCIFPQLSRQSSLSGRPQSRSAHTPHCIHAPPPHPQSRWAGCRHPRREGRTLSPPREGGTVWQHAGLPSPTWQPLVDRNQAWWGWLLPDTHTQLSVIKAISYLRTGELQAGAATARIAGRESGCIWAEVGGGRRSKTALRLAWDEGCLGSEALLGARGSARSFLHKQGFTSSFPWALRVSSLQNIPQRCHLSSAGSFASPPRPAEVSIHRAWSGGTIGYPSLQLCWEIPEKLPSCQGSRSL